MSIEVTRINRVRNQGSIKAFADVGIDTEVNGQTCQMINRGYRIIDNDGRIFVSGPSKKGSDNEYHMMTFTNSPLLKNAIIHAIMTAFEEL